jgi:hypothetical protein
VPTLADTQTLYAKRVTIESGSKVAAVPADFAVVCLWALTGPRGDRSGRCLYQQRRFYGLSGGGRIAPQPRKGRSHSRRVFCLLSADSNSKNPAEPS